MKRQENKSQVCLPEGEVFGILRGQRSKVVLDLGERWSEVGERRGNWNSVQAYLSCMLLHGTPVQIQGDLVWNRLENLGLWWQNSPMGKASIFCADSDQPCWFHLVSASFVVLQEEGFLICSLICCSVRWAQEFVSHQFLLQVFNPMEQGFTTTCISDCSEGKEGQGECSLKVLWPRLPKSKCFDTYSICRLI